MQKSWHKWLLGAAVLFIASYLVFSHFLWVVSHLLLVLGAAVAALPFLAKANGATQTTMTGLTVSLVGSGFAVLAGMCLMGVPGQFLYDAVLRPWFGRQVSQIPNGGAMAVGVFVSLLWPWAIPVGYAAARGLWARRPAYLRFMLVVMLEYAYLFALCYLLYRDTQAM